MNDMLNDAIFRGFAIFCRLGACLMLMPGFSSPRIGATVRLFLCLAVSLALYPRLAPIMDTTLAGRPDYLRYRLLLSECAIGGFIGVSGRYFFFGLESALVLGANAIGMTNAFIAQIADEELAPAFASLAMLCATMLFFASDQHLEVVRALVQSYDAIPPAGGFLPRLALVHVVDALAQAFLLGLRIGAPFFVYGMMINVISGLLNRLVPNIPVFFIMTPLIIALGLFLAYFSLGPSLALFNLGFALWLKG